VVGACGLALVCCGEIAFSALGKESDVMKRLSLVLSKDSLQDAETLLSALRDTQEDLIDIRKGLGRIANVGSRIAAGIDSSQTYSPNSGALPAVAYTSVW
jgi:hypothetical protein